MIKTLAPVGVAAALLAACVPLTAQADAPGTSGPCSGAGTGNPVQHTGNGHHSFTDAHNNCVNFVGTNNTAFLDDSNFNLVNMNGNNDVVHQFTNSSHNTISFAAGANFDTLSASNATGDIVNFDPGAVNDVVTLVGMTNDLVEMTQFAVNDYLIFTAGCGNIGRVIALSNLGTPTSPIMIC